MLGDGDRCKTAAFWILREVADSWISSGFADTLRAREPWISSGFADIRGTGGLCGDFGVRGKSRLMILLSKD